MPPLAAIDSIRRGVAVPSSNRIDVGSRGQRRTERFELQLLVESAGDDVNVAARIGIERGDRRRRRGGRGVIDVEHAVDLGDQLGAILDAFVALQPSANRRLVRSPCERGRDRRRGVEPLMHAPGRRIGRAARYNRSNRSVSQQIVRSSTQNPSPVRATCAERDDARACAVAGAPRFGVVSIDDQHVVGRKMPGDAALGVGVVVEPVVGVEVVFVDVGQHRDLRTEPAFVQPFELPVADFEHHRGIRIDLRQIRDRGDAHVPRQHRFGRHSRRIAAVSVEVLVLPLVPVMPITGAGEACRKIEISISTGTPLSRAIAR